MPLRGQQLLCWRGYLVTNAHVLGQAVNVDICLANGRLVVVEIVGRDPRTDIALLKAPMEFTIPQTASIPELGGRGCAGGNQFGCRHGVL